MISVALIPGNLLGKLPRINETEGIPYKDLMCVIRLFNPIGKETWYVIEYDPEKELAFGFVDLGGYPELGTFSLKELRELKLPFGLKIERDKNWKSKPLWLVERAHMAMYELSV